MYGLFLRVSGLVILEITSPWAWNKPFGWSLSWNILSILKYRNPKFLNPLFRLTDRYIETALLDVFGHRNL